MSLQIAWTGKHRLESSVFEFNGQREHEWRVVVNERPTVIGVDARYMVEVRVSDLMGEPFWFHVEHKKTIREILGVALVSLWKEKTK